MLHLYDKIFHVGFPYLDNALHECIIHSAGEAHINLKCKINYQDKILIKARLNNSNNIMELIMLADAISRCNRTYQSILDLYAPYMPYSRADRVVGNGGGDANGIARFSELISNFFKRIYTLDMHSTQGLHSLTLTNATISNHIPYEKFVRNLVKIYDIKDYCLVAPDAGSQDKVNCFANILKVPVFQLEKKRDQSEKGKIISFSPVNSFPGTKAAIILDDICDGGGTFIKAASCIPRPTKLFLGITHGIFSKGLMPLWSAGFEGIITTDSFSQHKHNYNDLIVLGVDTCL